MVHVAGQVQCRVAVLVARRQRGAEVHEGADGVLAAVVGGAVQRRPLRLVDGVDRALLAGKQPDHLQG